MIIATAYRKKQLDAFAEAFCPVVLPCSVVQKLNE
jgi:hypothetical protein